MGDIDVANDETIVNLVKTIEKNKKVRDALMISGDGNFDEDVAQILNDRVNFYRNILETRLKYLLGE